MMLFVFASISGLIMEENMLKKKKKCPISEFKGKNPIEVSAKEREQIKKALKDLGLAPKRAKKVG